MVSVGRRGAFFVLRFSAEEGKELGLDNAREYELSKARDGIWVMAEGGPGSDAGTAVSGGMAAGSPVVVDDAEQKIVGMLRKLAPRDRMEGWFERKLSAAEQEKFAQMLRDGRVRRFKSSQVFRKSLYTVPGESGSSPRPARRFENREKPIEEFSLEKDGFLVVRNETRAKALSEELKDRIKSGEIRGTRAFTGEFFIVQSRLLEAAEEKVLRQVEALKSCTLGQLSQGTGLTQTLVRIAAEFLKEDGMMIEKKRELYQYIG